MSYDAPLLFIDGCWLPVDGRDTSPVINPATEEALGRLPHASPADLDRALEAARRGYALWRKTSAYDRARLLRRAAELVRERVEHIATLLTLEEGKVLAEARLEVLAAADNIDWCAEEGRRSYGRVIPPRADGSRYLVLREPIGPVAAFSPWNFPATTPTRKIAAALAAGCSCIIKPSEETPATCLAIARAFDDAGLPKGVLNVVFGVPAEISTRLIASDVIRKISFTGSTAVGKHLAGLAATGAKRATMELGGHGPVIVFDDAAVDEAARLTIAGKFRNAGQVCAAPTRFFVHSSIHDRFVDRVSELANELVVGNGLDPATQMGPLANPRRMAAMDRLIGDALDRGARLAAGGGRIGNRGFFWQPTVLADVPMAAQIMSEEPFGPVILTRRFDDFDTVIAEANGLVYGLAAYAFTTSVRTATAVADALECGLVGINTYAINVPETPFGGVKESGYGSEGGTEGLDAYLSTKFVHQA